VLYFSLSSDNPIVAGHCAKGGTAFVAHDGEIMRIDGERRTAILPIADIPITLGGAAHFQVANVLAVAAACSAYGLSVDAIARCLAGFTDNPGRCTIYRFGEGYVMIDYGHNPEALRQMSAMAERLPVGRITGVIALPGDRADHVIEDAARVAARGFDRIIIKEDRDLRGRASGEVATLVYRAIRSEVPGHDCIVIRDESEAVQRALVSIEPNELVIIFYEHLESIEQLLARLGAVPAAGIEEAREPGSEEAKKRGREEAKKRGSEAETIRRSGEPTISGNHDWVPWQPAGMLRKE
jgi:cyanophycin synthetase